MSCKHTRVDYRDRLNVVLLRRDGAYRAECRACGAVRPIGPADDNGVPPAELKLAHLIAETLHEDPDPEMTRYHWAALIDIMLDELLRHDAARSRPRSPLEQMIDAACGRT